MAGRVLINCSIEYFSILDLRFPIVNRKLVLLEVGVGI
jgi:hypothetical protein